MEGIARRRRVVVTSSQRWGLRSLYAFIFWFIGWALAAWIGAQPQPVLLALAIFAASAVCGVVFDSLAIVTKAEWTPAYRSNPRNSGLDPRFSRLSRSFTDGTDLQLVAERVHEILCQVVDGLLVNGHGIHRQQDPQGARRVLGDKVADYLERPVHYHRGYFQQLRSLLSRIESL